MIKIILADDHRLFRDGIKSIINCDGNIEVVGEFDNGIDLLEAIPRLNPNLIITDISMPEMSGIEATKIISEKYPEIPVLILSMHNNEAFICNSIKAGAKGYLPKDIRREELISAIYAINKGENYFSREINDIILNSYINKVKNHDNSADKEKSLTKRELEIIKLVGEGLINKEIAAKLFISVRTVDCHKNNIMHKLNIRSSIELIKYAIKHELIEL